MTEILGKALYVLGLDPTDKYETILFTKVQRFVLSELISSFYINTITSTDIPEEEFNLTSLQYLFPFAVGRKSINDFGDESRYEALLAELSMLEISVLSNEDEDNSEQHQQISIISGTKSKLPPYTADLGRDAASNVPLLPASTGGLKEETEEKNSNNEEEEDEDVKSSVNKDAVEKLTDCLDKSTSLFSPVQSSLQDTIPTDFPSSSNKQIVKKSKTKKPKSSPIRQQNFSSVNISEGEGEIEFDCQLRLNIKGDAPVESTEVSNNRVMWCSPKTTNSSGVEESDAVGTNKTLLLGVVHGLTFEVLQIYTIEKELSVLARIGGRPYDPVKDRAELVRMSHTYQDLLSYRCSPDRFFEEQFFENGSLPDGFLPYLVYTDPGDNSIITRLVISRDATALAVALRDGTVRFFTFNGKSSSGLNHESCLWAFGNGSTVWNILFFDDCRAGSSRRYVVVGSAFNRQLKLFRCDTWDCLQTVSFQSMRRFHLDTTCLLSAHIDRLGRYLIMSDIHRKALYVLELDSIDINEPKIFTNVQRFPLTDPISSLNIVNTTNSADILVKEISTTYLEETEEEDNRTDLDFHYSIGDIIEKSESDL